MGKSAICCCIPIGDQECREDTKTMHHNIQQRGTGLQGRWEGMVVMCGGGFKRDVCKAMWDFQERC